MVPSINPSIRTFFLVIMFGIAISAIGNAMSALQNSSVIATQQEVLENDEKATEERARLYAALNQSLANEIKQSELFNQWNSHFNSTSTAAPVVLENRELLHEILAILNSSSSSSSITNTTATG